MISRIRLKQAAAIINAGGIIAYPTEAVYGLGCHPDSMEAVANILALKQRSMRAGLIIISDCVARLAPWIDPSTEELSKLREPRSMPTTWIVTAHADAPAWLTGGRPRIAVRLTRHPIAGALCAAADAPLVSTSANRRGRRPARTALQARRWFGDDLDFVVPGATGAHSRPSEIRDASTDELMRP